MTLPLCGVQGVRLYPVLERRGQATSDVRDLRNMASLNVRRIVMDRLLPRCASSIAELRRRPAVLCTDCSALGTVRQLGCNQGMPRHDSAVVP